MGAYAECWLDSWQIGSTKSVFDPRLMQLFRRSDKRIHKSTVKNLQNPLPSWIERDDQDEVAYFVYYSAPIVVIRDRLELLGYTLTTTKKAFMRNIRAQAEKYSEPTAGMEDYFNKRVQHLNSIDVDKWLASIREMKRLHKSPATNYPRHKSDVSLEEFMLEDEQWYGYSGPDLYVPLRLMLETCKGSDSTLPHRFPLAIEKTR